MDFWKKQPTGISEKCNGVIEVPIDVSNNRTQLPDGYKWQELNCEETICKFLTNNYVQDADFKLIYNKEVFSKLLNNPKHKKCYSLGLYHNSILVGYVFGKEHKANINQHEEKILSVNFMCIKSEFRNKNLAPLLITEIKRISYVNGIYSAVFANDENRGFCFTELTYYHLPLNTQNIKKVMYLPHNTIDCHYKMRNDTVLVENDEYIDEILTIYNETCKTMLFNEIFDKETLEYELKTLNNCNYTLFNRNRKEFISFYIIKTQITKKNKNITKAVLYYWGGSRDILEDALAFCKDKLNIDMFDILNMGNNETKIIEEFPFLIGSGKLFYHMFNYNNSLTARSRVNFILY